MAELGSHAAGNVPTPWSAVGDTVRMPWSMDGAITETVVPPALAVLFRMAVGPGADFYVPRLLKREGNPRAAPGWVWPAFFFPAGWAFYRKEWWIGVLFGLFPFLGLGAFLAAGERLDGSEVAWWGALVTAVAIVPGIAAATLALWLLHRRLRQRIRSAEAIGDRPDRIAALLAERDPTSWLHGLLLGFAAFALWLALALPVLENQREERAVRAGIAASLAVVAPLREAILESRAHSISLPAALQGAAPESIALAAAGLETIAVDPGNGRLRLTFAPAMRLLAGKSLLLAPVIDARQQLQWLCVPIDIPARLLPRECRRR